MSGAIENRDYKLADYLARSADYYALTKYRIVMAWLPKTPNLRVLNAGCGSGEMNVLLAQNPTWQVEAIDVDPEAVRISEQLKAEHQLDNLTVWQCSIEALERPLEYYDVIVSNDVLEHIKEDVPAMKKLADLLNPHGVLCISVPALQALFGYHDEQLAHYRRYNQHNLTRKLRQYFVVKRCRYFAAILIPIALIYSCWLRKPYPVGEPGKESLVTKLLKFLLSLDAKLPLPTGTSLIAMATPKPIVQPGGEL
ncbi:class I SAM-dependent methyltransferase [Phormidium tenue FACHB-886]|nr:class I SAM-dependent methyltransferase [Phormidium tenue FACHB-886]